MAFTAVNVGDQISPNLDQILLELKTALNERETAISRTPTSGWYTTGRIETDAEQYIVAIRAAIETLLVEWGDSVFLKLDGVTLFTNIADLLNEAGYPSGWITLVGGSISNRLIYVQLQNVFLQMLKIRKIKAANPLSSVRYRYGIGEGSEEANWDEAVAGTFETYTAGYPKAAYDIAADVPPTGWVIVGGSGHRYDTSGWPTQLGALDYVRHAYFVDAIPNGNTSGQMVVDLNGGDETITVLLNETTDGAFTADLVSGFTFGVDYEMTAESVDPANQPWTPRAGKKATLYINATSTAAGDLNVPAEFYFTITSAMTYG